jgi:hypothetical protein
MAVEWLEHLLHVQKITNLVVSPDTGCLDSCFRGFRQSVQTNTITVSHDWFLPHTSTLLNKPRNKQTGVYIWNTEICSVFRLFEIVSQEMLAAQRPLLPAALQAKRCVPTVSVSSPSTRAPEVISCPRAAALESDLSILPPPPPPHSFTTSFFRP